MPKWSGDAVPPKYRHLQKRIDAIEEALKALPKPRVDFFALSPKERDLYEIYLRCLYITKDKNNTYLLEQELDEDQSKAFKRDLLELLTQTLVANDLEQLLILLNNLPLFIEKDFFAFWNREHPPQLMHFLSQQQSLYRWIPSPGRLQPAQLTWEAWDELLSLVNAHGYNEASDDISNILPLEKWSISNKKRIVHLYLEMITTKDVLASFLAVQKYDGEAPQIRKRLPIREESRHSGITHRKRKGDE